LIKEHAGITVNELADHMEKQAAKIPMSALLASLKQVSFEK
jgi:hypothetical protein